jgi:GT2 family glycosyltransferase
MSINESPLVTINILSFNRKDDLRHTLTKVSEQDYKNLEVIVVDNASLDGTPEMVEREFPDIRLIKMDKNIGIAGWNKGFEVATGEYILTLDDDSYPDNNTINTALKCISESDNIGVLYLPIYNLYHNIFECEYIDKNNPKMFVGCGALIKNSIFKKVGTYNEHLFLYEHEIEFSMRVYDNDFIIRHCKDAIIFHRNSLLNRNVYNKIDHRKIYYVYRNYIIILFLHFNIVRILFFMPQLILARMILAIKYGATTPAIKGFCKGFTFLPRLLYKRNTLQKDIQKFYKYGNYMGRFKIERNY